MKRLSVLLLLITLLVAAPTRGDITSRTLLSRALANALYCQVAGCTITGTLTLGGKIIGTDNSATTTLGDATHRFVTFASRIVTGASTPTAAVTGAGTTAAANVGTGSSDAAGTIAIASSGTGQAATGTVTLTFSTGNGAYGTNPPVCVAMLSSQSAAWNARATIIGNTFATTSAVFTWDNNAVLLVAASTYVVHYECIGK